MYLNCRDLPVYIQTELIKIIYMRNLSKKDKIAQLMESGFYSLDFGSAGKYSLEDRPFIHLYGHFGKNFFLSISDKQNIKSFLFNKDN